MCKNTNYYYFIIHTIYTLNVEILVQLFTIYKSHQTLKEDINLQLLQPWKV